MFTTYRVPPLRRRGFGEGVRPLNALLAEVRGVSDRLAARVAAGFAGHPVKTHRKRGSKLIRAA